MAVNDIYRFAISYNIGSERTMNVMHFKEVTACTDALPGLSLANAVHPIVDAFYAGVIISQETQVILYQIQRVQPAAGVPVTIILGAAPFLPIVGSGVADPVPSVAAALVSFYTALHTRNGRGRIYLPGLSVLAQNDGQLVQAAIDACQDYGNDWTFDIVPGGALTGEWHACVYSRLLGDGELITHAVAHSNMATQRSRRNFPGVGT